MKKYQSFVRILLCALITGTLASVLSFPASAQDSTKTVSKKGIVVLKIKKEDNGKTTVIDTTFTITNPSGQMAFEDYMKKHEEELGKLGEELENIEVLVDIPDFPDSMVSDSVIKQLKFIGKDFSCPRHRWHGKPEGFDYEFNNPCPPDVSFPPFHGYDDFEEEFLSDHDMRVFRYDNQKQTLSDIIGDIPMDRVKSYSIKDTKHGKRIIVDIEDGPLIEKKDRVIIIREPGKSVHKKDHSGSQMKVIIKSDDDRQTEKPDEPSSPPPPGKQGNPDEPAPKNPGF
jgi:hypothetical protein